MVLTIAIVSCSKNDDPVVDPNAQEECVISIYTSGISYSDLTKSRAVGDAADLLGVQIYTVVDGVDTPYANGLFSDWSALQFNGLTNTTYKIVASLVVDAETVIYLEGSTYGKPFETAKGDEFVYDDVELTALANSTAQLCDGTYSTIPNVDRYYGEASKLVTADDLSISTTMKRIAFGVKATGELEDGESITVKISGAPEVELLKDEYAIFTHQYITSAYSADESEDSYSENINTEVLRNGGAIYSDNVTYKRNKLTVLTVDKSGITVGFDFDTPFEDGETETPDQDPTAYITQVFDYVPAPGQFVNTMPAYEDGDTQATMNEKVLAAIGNNNKGMISLGSYGGYVTLGFNHTIQNVEGKLDFRVLGNAFYSASNPDEDNLEGGSCEPGIIMVSVDTNENGIPDDEWYEIQGSSHIDHTSEAWYSKAVENGNDANFYFNDFELTYTKNESEPESADYSTYIPWSDNKGNTGYVEKNMFYSQAYYPQWVDANTLTFTGSRLPQNGINEAESGSYFVLYKFGYGYADNAPDDEDYSAIDISWAVDSQGNKANLSGVDFIKIYNGVMQMNGWLGECSTEICGVDDLHVLDIDIDSW